MIADDCDGIVDAHHLVHALDRNGLAVVDAFELAAKHWAVLDGGVQHAGHLEI